MKKMFNSFVKSYPYPAAALAIVGAAVVISKAVDAVKEKMAEAKK